MRSTLPGMESTTCSFQTLSKSVMLIALEPQLRRVGGYAKASQSLATKWFGQFDRRLSCFCRIALYYWQYGHGGIFGRAGATAARANLGRFGAPCSREHSRGVDVFWRGAAESTSFRIWSRQLHLGDRRDNHGADVAGQVPAVRRHDEWKDLRLHG